jgi:hypothetical protein
MELNGDGRPLFGRADVGEVVAGRLKYHYVYPSMDDVEVTIICVDTGVGMVPLHREGKHFFDELPLDGDVRLELCER